MRCERVVAQRVIGRARGGRPTLKVGKGEGVDYEVEAMERHDRRLVREQAAKGEQKDAR